MSSSNRSCHRLGRFQITSQAVDSTNSSMLSSKGSSFLFDTRVIRSSKFLTPTKIWPLVCPLCWKFDLNIDVFPYSGNEGLCAARAREPSRARVLQEQGNSTCVLQA
ncbi:hypothetical protein Droror1_Dr00000373 [Drosera rotundifolia]